VVRNLANTWRDRKWWFSNFTSKLGSTSDQECLLVLTRVWPKDVPLLRMNSRIPSYITWSRQHMFSKPSNRWTGRDELDTIKIDKQGCHLLSLEHPEEVICIRHRLHIRMWHGWESNDIRFHFRSCEPNESTLVAHLVTIIRRREDCYKLSIMFNFVAFILYFMGSDNKIW